MHAVAASATCFSSSRTIRSFRSQRNWMLQNQAAGQIELFKAPLDQFSLMHRDAS
jgi:hypothetical protein